MKTKMADTQKNGIDIVKALLSLALFIIALIAWMQNKQLSGLVQKKWGDPLGKGDATHLANSAQNLTFLLWLVPLIVGILSVVFMLFRGRDKHEDGDFKAGKVYQREQAPSQLRCRPVFAAAGGHRLY